MPPPALLEALSVGSAAAIVVMVLADASVAASAWSQAGRRGAEMGMLNQTSCGTRRPARPAARREAPLGLGRRQSETAAILYGRCR